MFQAMMNGSIAVLTRPSVATFEEHEQNNLGWATIYVALGAVLAAIFGAIAFAIQRPAIEQQLQELQEQLGELGAQSPLGPSVMQPSLSGFILNNLLGTLIGFFIFLGVVFLLGRAFGGSGNFGELAYDISLFWAPLMVLRALIGIISIGPLSFLVGLASLAIGIYNIYLTFLGIQSGMNLPSNKALAVIGILVGIVLVIVLCVAVVFATALATVFG